MAPNTVPMGVYLWKRLASIGIEHVFGVPGDFNCTVLPLTQISENSPLTISSDPPRQDLRGPGAYMAGYL